MTVFLRLLGQGRGLVIKSKTSVKGEQQHGPAVLVAISSS